MVSIYTLVPRKEGDINKPYLERILCVAEGLIAHRKGYNHSYVIIVSLDVFFLAFNLINTTHRVHGTDYVSGLIMFCSIRSRTAKAIYRHS